MPLNTVYLPIDAPNAMAQAVSTIESGGIIVFPTDTLYGMACNPYDPIALHALYLAKDRPAQKAIPVLLAHTSQLANLVHKPSRRVVSLMEHYWPGALTLVLRKRAGLPKELSPYPTLAVRVPNHPLARRLLTLTGPLAVTSANLSGKEPPATGQEVFEQLSGRVDLILDGGSLTLGQASTILDCSSSVLQLLRQGPIPFTELMATWQAA